LAKKEKGRGEGGILMRRTGKEKEGKSRSSCWSWRCTKGLKGCQSGDPVDKEEVKRGESDPFRSAEKRKRGRDRIG